MRFKITRGWVAVCFLVGVSFVSGIDSFFFNPPKKLVTNDGTLQWEARMRAVRERLPASVREVGYISGSENLASTIQEYLLTKYALIPVVVRQGTDYEWIVANFTQTQLQPILDAKIPQGYTLEKLGAGIFLIHRNQP
jgi:hypothetical protein